jgi:hypothetical protein
VRGAETVTATSGNDGDLTRIYDIVETNVDNATEFLSSRVKHLYRWWALANEGRMPKRKMFDILDHRSIVANLFVVDVLPSREFQFRILGEEVIRIIGRNRTGETVTHKSKGEYGHELYEYYRTVAANRLCRKCTGTLMFAIGGARRFESIDCPLADDNADTVAAIIGVMDVVK